MRFGIIAFGLSALVVAGTEVDQGKPGKSGAWPVLINGGALTLSSAVTIDGGVVGITPTTANRSSTSATTALTGTGTACTSPAGAGCTIVLNGPSFDGLGIVLYQNVTMSVSNTGANTVTDFLIEWSPDATHYEVWDSTTFAGLATGVTKSLAMTGNSRRFLRMESRASANTTVQILVDATSQAY